jgi:sulfonate transport system substrate-binding protein
MKKGKISALLLIFLLSLVLMGCGETSTNTSQSGGDNKLFTLRAVTQTGFSETIIADQLGFFKDEGIQINYIGTLGQGISQYQAVEQGDIDVFTGGHLTDLTKARLAGLTSVAVAPGIVDDPDLWHVVYLVPNNSSIHSIADFAGKKVAISGTSVCTDGFIRKYFQDHGLDYNSIQFVTLPQAGQMEQAVVNGLVDVTTSHPPYGGKALAAGGVRKVGDSFDIVGTAAGGLSVRGFSEKFIKEHPAVVQGFVNATYRARLFVLANPAYSKIVTAKFFGLKPEEVSIFAFTNEKDIPPDWADLWFKMSEDLGYWKHGDITPDQVYTNKFVPKDPPASDAQIGKDTAK